MCFYTFGTFLFFNGSWKHSQSVLQNVGEASQSSMFIFIQVLKADQFSAWLDVFKYVTALSLVVTLVFSHSCLIQLGFY